jgi:outer membrane lipase/esterase
MKTLKLGILAALAAGVAPTADAANAAFQNFFFTVCQNPTAALAARCGETGGGQGNLSGDSESSLNPSQVLSNNRSTLSAARSRAEQMREYSAAAREDRGEIELGRSGLLFIGRGVWEEADRVVDLDAERGYQSDSQAFDFGFERRVSERVGLGLLLTYEGIAGEFDRERPGVNFSPVSDTAGEIEVRSLGATVYMTAQWGERGYVDLAAGYIDSQFDLSRRVVFQESARVVPQTNVSTSADPDGQQYWATLNLGCDWSKGAWTFGTHASGLWAQSEQDPYEERDLAGSGLAMRFDVAKRESLLAAGGLHASRAIKVGFGVLVPQLRVDYLHEFELDAQSADASFLLDANRSVYRFAGDEPDRSYGVASLGLTAILPNGWMPYLNVDSVVGNDDSDRYRVTLGLRREL